MIGVLWRRWFDAREHRRAHAQAELNYSGQLVRTAYEKARADLAERRLAEVVEAADGRTAGLHERAVNAELARDEARQYAKSLEAQLDERNQDARTRKKIADEHAEVRILPPALTRDRQNAARLAAENADLRQKLETLQRKYEGNPS